MEAYLEVNSENVEDLNNKGIPCIEGEELVCDVEYDINHADPEVGIMSDDAQITSVTWNGPEVKVGVDVESFFDMDKLHAEAVDDWRNQYQDTW